MAPKICVPADFGKHHIGAPSHGNLQFNLQGVKVHANSIILSLNSPVIENLTTSLQLTSLDAEDFSKDAVDCFIEATYTGEIEVLNLGNFRHVNKMSLVFNVSWLIARCEEYFVSYVKNLNSESSYSDMLFAVEEAVYQMSAIKSRNFLDILVDRMSFVSVYNRANFIKRYLNLSDLPQAHLSRHRINACIAVVKSDVHVLIELLILHLEKQGNICLDENTRYLLKNVDLSSCYDRNSDLHTKLYSVLGNLQCVGKDDFQLLLSITKQLTSRSVAQTNDMKGSYVAHSSKSRFVPVNFIQSFMFTIDRINSENLIKCLATHDDVHDFYVFFDGLWFQLFQVNQIPTNSIASKIQSFMRGKQDWAKLDYEYIDCIYETKQTSGFLSELKLCDKLVTSKKFSSKIIFFDFVAPDGFVEAVFLQNSCFKFQIPDPGYAGQQFVLKTTAMIGDNPDTFHMKYGLLNPKCNQLCPKLHFALEAKFGSSSRILPISWNGKPTCDETKTYWNWGYIKFHNWELNRLDMKYGSASPRNIKHFISILEDSQCRLIAFVCFR